MNEEIPTGARDRQATRTGTRWYQFSFASLMLLLTVTAAACGYWRHLASQGQRQLKTAAALADLGGTFRTESVLPEWLRWIPMADQCCRVVEVNLEGREIPAGTLDALLDLPKLRRLYLARSSVSDADMPIVAQLSNLQRLSLWRTKISSHGVSHLSTLAELRVLDIHANPNMDEEVLEHLPSWPKLKLLTQWFAVTDEGLARLAAHPNIPVTSIRAERVSNRGVEQLRRLRRLVSLDVQLECDKSKVLELSQLDKLGWLRIHGQPEPYVRQLQSKLPNLQYCDIRRLRGSTFDELADRWSDRCQELEIHGSYPWRTEHFNREPIKLKIVQHEPLACIEATVDDISWDKLASFRRLNAITIEGHGFDSANLAVMSQIPNLQQLHLRVAIDDRGIREIGSIRTLQHLSISGVRTSRINLAVNGCDPLGQLSDLRTFRTVLSGMDDRQLSFLENCAKLRRVYFHDILITGDVFACLQDLPELEEIVIYNCRRLTNDGVERLRTFKNLRTCWFDGNNISSDVRDRILASLPALENDRTRRARLMHGFGPKVYEELP